MARTTKLSFSVARTIGQPNYGSVRVEESEEIELEPGDDVAKETSELHVRVYTRFLNSVSFITGTKA